MCKVYLSIMLSPPFLSGFFFLCLLQLERMETWVSGELGLGNNVEIILSGLAGMGGWEREKRMGRWKIGVRSGPQPMSRGRERKKRGEVWPKQTDWAMNFSLALIADYFQLCVKECYCWAASSSPPLHRLAHSPSLVCLLSHRSLLAPSLHAPTRSLFFYLFPWPVRGLGCSLLPSMRFVI